MLNFTRWTPTLGLFFKWNDQKGPKIAHLGIFRHIVIALVNLQHCFFSDFISNALSSFQVPRHPRQWSHYKEAETMVHMSNARELVVSKASWGKPRKYPEILLPSRDHCRIASGFPKSAHGNQCGHRAHPFVCQWIHSVAYFVLASPHIF